MRQLVTIQKIHSIKSIPGRDRVVQAKVLGYTVIIPKDVYQENELVCYAEIDSVFPDNGEWEDLRNVRFRIKQFKVNSEDGPIYGQGFVFSLDKFNSLVDYDKYPGGLEEGDEVTDIVGVTKYEPPINYSVGDTKGIFPTKYLSMTDEMRLQSKPKLIEELQGKPYYYTMKMDGSSTTFLITPEEKEFLVCSRTLTKKSPKESGKSCVFWKVAEEYNIEKVLREFPNIAIQGEICGEKIQENRLGIKGHKLFIFNLIDLDKRQYLHYTDFYNTIKEMKKITPWIEHVPILEEGNCFNYSVEDLIKKSKINYKSGKAGEGIVIRPQEPTYSKILQGPLSFKVINPEFLSSGGN